MIALRHLSFVLAALMCHSMPASAQVAMPLTPELTDKVAQCAACHGEDGLPVVEDAPIIWGQEFYYLYVQMRDFQAGRRENEIMQPIVDGLSKDDMKAIAQHFAEKKWPDISFQATPEEEARAEQAAVAGQCTACHLGAYTGNSRVPRVAGQNAKYLEKTMLDFKYNRRRNMPDMASLLRTMPDEDVIALSRFAAGK